MSKLREAAEELSRAWRGASLAEMIVAVHAMDDALAEERLNEFLPEPYPRKGEARMSIETGGPAFPHPAGWRRDPHISDGMTLRDYFAAAALTGILANPDFDTRGSSDAEVAWRYADEMLKARGKQE